MRPVSSAIVFFKAVRISWGFCSIERNDKARASGWSRASSARVALCNPLPLSAPCHANQSRSTRCASKRALRAGLGVIRLLKGTTSQICGPYPKADAPDDHSCKSNIGDHAPIISNCARAKAIPRVGITGTLVQSDHIGMADLTTGSLSKPLQTGHFMKFSIDYIALSCAPFKERKAKRPHNSTPMAKNNRTKPPMGCA